MKNVPLTQEELLFLTDMMMGCQLGFINKTASDNSVDENNLYNYLMAFIDEEEYHD